MAKGPLCICRIPGRGKHQERDGLFVSEGWDVKGRECRDDDRNSWECVCEQRGERVSVKKKRVRVAKEKRVCR